MLGLYTEKRPDKWLYRKLDTDYLIEFVLEYQMTSHQHIMSLLNRYIMDGAGRQRLYSIFSNNEEIFYDRQRKMFRSATFRYVGKNEELSMLKCQWVLLDFIATVADTHYRMARPSHISSIAMESGKNHYEIVYVPPGKEPYIINRIKQSKLQWLAKLEVDTLKGISQSLLAERIVNGRYIVVLDSLEHKDELVHMPEILMCCVMDEENERQYFGNVNAQSAAKVTDDAAVGQ